LNSDIIGYVTKQLSLEKIQMIENDSNV